MKIMIVLDSFGFLGGPERRAFRIAKGLKELGHDVSVASIMRLDEKTTEKAQEEKISVFGITNENNKALKSFRVDVFWKLRRLIKRLRPDYIFTFEFMADYSTKMALLGMKIPVITFIGSTEWKWERKLHRRVFMNYFVKKSKYYIANSNTVRSNIIRVLRKAKDKIRVVYNPIDLDYFEPVDERVKFLQREKHGVPKEDFVIGSVVRFYNPKGADVLVEAFFKSGLKGVLVLVGDGGLRGKLVNMVEKFGIKDKVFFLGSLEANKYIYGMFDVCVVPSQKGGFDNVVLESIACCVPTIATVATGIGEVAQHKKHLYICGTTPDDIANAMNDVHENYSEAKESACNGRRLLEDELSINKVATSIDELLK